jgi:excisionase family DNA binding protein
MHYRLDTAAPSSENWTLSDAMSDGAAMETKLTLTVMEAAELLGIGRSTAYEAVASGKIPTLTIGHRKLVPRAGLMRMIEDASAPKTPEAT